MPRQDQLHEIGTHSDGYGTRVFLSDGTSDYYDRRSRMVVIEDAWWSDSGSQAASYRRAEIPTRRQTVRSLVRKLLRIE